MAWMWNVLPACAFETLGPQTVVLSWEVMDPLEVWLWGQAFWLQLGPTSGCSLPLPISQDVSKQPRVLHVLYSYSTAMNCSWSHTFPTIMDCTLSEPKITISFCSVALLGI